MVNLLECSMVLFVLLVVVACLHLCCSARELPPGVHFIILLPNYLGM